MAARDVLVYGAGSIGLIACVVATARKTGRVQVVEPHVIRREAALASGAAGAAGSAADLDLAAGADIVIAPTAPVPVAPFEVFEKELTVIGSNSLGNCCPAAVDSCPTSPPSWRAW